MASTRFPGKPLAMLAGKPLIEWTWRAAARTGLKVVIATPDREIAQVAYRFGALVARTGEAKNGTERCADALDRTKLDVDTVINWQGDAPLTPPAWALRLVSMIESDQAADAATLFYPGTAHEGLVRCYQRNGVADHFIRCHRLTFGDPVAAHVGLYAYRPSALRQYGTSPSWSERAGDLEQCRWIDRKFRLIVGEVEPPEFEMREVNYPGDIEPVAALLSREHAHP